MHDITRNRDGMDQYMQPDRSHAMHANTSAVPQQPKRDASHDDKLEQGERGEQVKQLQSQLAQLGAVGCDGKPPHADGDFGGNTKYAVEQFQRERGLQVDGVVGQPSASGPEPGIVAAHGQADCRSHECATDQESVAFRPSPSRERDV